ncbi:MAG: hypothetical protein IJX57_04970, partial [Clostridia bacterium]|nr:hypothetical protein [Clostridia bacterium]
MKKVLAFMMAAMMVVSLSACKKEEVPESVPREPVTPAPAAALVGSYTLTAEYLPFETPLINDESNS